MNHVAWKSDVTQGPNGSLSLSLFSSRSEMWWDASGAPSPHCGAAAGPRPPSPSPFLLFWTSPSSPRPHRLLPHLPAPSTSPPLLLLPPPLPHRPPPQRPNSRPTAALGHPGGDGAGGLDRTLQDGWVINDRFGRHVAIVFSPAGIEVMVSCQFYGTLTPKISQGLLLFGQQRFRLGEPQGSFEGRKSSPVSGDTDAMCPIVVEFYIIGTRC